MKVKWKLDRQRREGSVQKTIKSMCRDQELRKGNTLGDCRRFNMNGEWAGDRDKRKKLEIQTIIPPRIKDVP